MIYPYDACEVSARWGRRATSPVAIADRFLSTIDSISVLAPLLASWTWIDRVEFAESDGEAGKYPLDAVRYDIKRFIEANVTIDEGIKAPNWGYFLLAGTDQTAKEAEVTLAVEAGDARPGASDLSPFHNRATCAVSSTHDRSLATYDVLRAVLLILAETWEASWATTEVGDILSVATNRTFRCAWMSYLSPHFAPRVSPPATAIVEHRPNGGLFMAATRDPFSIENPQHLAVAREIETALTPLDELPYPIDDPYR